MTKKFSFREFEIAVCPGEILTLIGPVGAGKSTIIKSITKQLEILGGNGLRGGKATLADRQQRAGAKKYP